MAAAAPYVVASTHLSDSDKARLRELALEAAHNSYSPYSRFRVGSALLLNDGAIITG